LPECAQSLNTLVKVYKEYREKKDEWNNITLKLGLDPLMWSTDLYRRLATGGMRFENGSLCRAPSCISIRELVKGKDPACIPIREFVKAHTELTEKRGNFDRAVKVSRVTCEDTERGEIKIE